MIKKVKTLLSLLLTAVNAVAQQDMPIQFESIHGLSQNTVYSVLRDKKGFTWIATANGLNRYDGAEMKTYKPSFGDIPGQMKGRIIRSDLIEDDKEQIWMGTDKAVNCYNKRTQRFTQHKLFIDTARNKMGNEEISTKEFFANPIFIKENHLWLATAAEGVFDLNISNGKCRNYFLPKDEQGNEIMLMYNGAYNGNDKIWFGSKKGLLCFDLKTRHWSRSLNNIEVFTVSYCRDSLFIGNNNGITWYDIKSASSGPVTINKIPGFSDEGMIRRIYKDNLNNIWAGDQKGNIYYKSSGESSFNWRGNINGNSVSKTNYPVYCLNADTTGNLWVGADVLGLLKTEIAPRPFKFYPQELPAAGNQHLFMYSICEDENEMIWLGTFQNGLIKLNKKTGATEPVRFPYYDPSLIYGKSVPLIKKDKFGNLWTSYSGYLYIKEKGKKDFLPVKFPPVTLSLQTPQLWSLTEYEDGWILATNVGLFTVNKKGSSYIVNYISSFGGSKVVKVWVAPNQKIWVVPETGGVFILNKVSQKRFEIAIFPTESIKGFCYDEATQLVWIGTTNGLIAYHLPDGKHRIYNEKDGMLSSYIYGVLQSGDELWLSTNNGIAKAKLSAEKQSFFPSITFTSFTRTEGLPANEFNTGAYYKGESGNLYFGSVNGVVWFNPKDVKVNFPSPLVQLIGFTVNEKEADSTTAPEYLSQISLPYYKNNLFFRFRGIDYNTHNVKYKYQLQGWDKDWIYSNQLNEVRYNKLPDGDYLFKVMASSGSGTWNEHAYTVSIIIYPPFWRTWWFYAIAVLAILSAIILITRFFVQQKLKTKIAELEKQKEIDKERQRISREMHDDIGAGLTQITLMSESVKNKIQSAELDDIAGTSRKLVSNMSEIIWSLNPENKTLDQLCSYLREQLNKQLEYSGIDYSIQLPEDGNSVLLSNEQRRNIILVSKEIVNNAIKYSRANHIAVKAELLNNELHFEIKDDGVGFEPGKPSFGNGLRNIKQRVAESGGKLSIQSSHQSGSLFTYFIPLGK